MSAAKSMRKTDTHWDDAVPPKSKDVSKEALAAYKTAKLYVRLRLYVAHSNDRVLFRVE